jgi:hypothetical protein
VIWANIGVGTHYAPGWCNVDVVSNEQVHPDVVTSPGVLPFPDKSAERVFCGHVLEHMPWPEVPAFLAEVKRVLSGELLVNGPDVHRTIRRFAEGREPWHMVETVLEYEDGKNAGFEDGGAWPNARHWWNCTEERVVNVLASAGFGDVAPVEPPETVVQDDFMPPWPVVGAAPWHLFVKATA